MLPTGPRGNGLNQMARKLVGLGLSIAGLGLRSPNVPGMQGPAQMEVEMNLRGSSCQFDV